MATLCSQCIVSTMYYSPVLTVFLLFRISLIRSFLHEEFPNDWIEQPLDHFNDSDPRTWNQTYYKIMDHWKPDGPILLFLVGHGCWASIHNANDKHFFINEIAEEMDAAYLIVDPRFYGMHKPYEHLTVEIITHATSRQELADIANLLTTLKKSQEFKKSKVIVAGGFHGGTLAVWMKLLYPDLIDAVLSSSAPVLAKKDFPEYYETVTEIFRTYGSQECVNEIIEKFSYLYNLFQSPEGIEQLKVEYNICEKNDMTLPENQGVFFSQYIYPFEYVANNGNTTDVSSKCKNISLIEPETRFPVIHDVGGCYIYDFKFWLSFSLVSIMNKLPWLYQSCTEFGYLQPTYSSMFGNALPLDFYYKMCSTAFGKEYNEERMERGIINTNRMYEGLTPNVTNAVFVNGDMDAWRPLEVQQDISADAPLINIKGNRPCTDFYVRPSDSDDLKEARKRIIKLLKKWTGQA